jgi:hypothetical protein
MENTEIVSTFAHHDDILDLLRDIWPQISGANILWFQNDIFYKLRLLETKAGCEGRAAGFLPASFWNFLDNAVDNEAWKSGLVWAADYDRVWNALFAEMEPSADGTGIDPDSLLEAVDELEEDVCGWIQDMIPADYNFFIAALDEGILNAEWLDKAQLFLEKAINDKKVETAIVPSTDAAVMKEIVPPRQRKHTRRRLVGLPLTPSHITPIKRRFRLTRRHNRQTN